MRQLLRRAWFAIRQRRFETELNDELKFHQEMAARELEACGIERAKAALASRRAFGSTALTQNHSRDVWIWPWLQDLAQDVRFGARLLVKDWRFTLAAVFALALGLGATTTAFTFLNGSTLRVLPFDNPARLVWIKTVDARGRPLGVSYADIEDWRAAARTLSHVVISRESPINISEEALAPQRYHGSAISFEAFDMLGRAPNLGRSFMRDDDRHDAPRVAIIAHTLWQNRYGGEPSIIGRSVRVNDVPSTIIAVMPAGFHFPGMTEVWIPVGQISGSQNTIGATRGNRLVTTFAFGRLAAGMSLAQAQAEMDAITGRLARDYAASNEGISVALEPIENLYWGGESGLKQMLLLVMGAVSFVLLIACVNVANLLLARAIHRSREIAIRSSLGATRWRIVRQLFVESLLLAVVAGSFGFVLSLVGVGIFSRAVAEMALDGPQPFWLTFSIDGRVFAFLAAACLGATILFGLAPALHISKMSNDVLKDGGRGAAGGVHARRWTGVLMVTQLALTLMLLAGAGLMLRSFLVVYRAGRVLDTSGMITMRLALGPERYAGAAQIKQFFGRLDERLASARAFSAVTVASDVPMMTLTNSLRQLTIEGRAAAPDERPATVAYLYIGPRYFETLKLRLLRGREFTEDDGAPGQEAAIVNQRFASMFFPDADPIGRRIRLANAAAPNAPKPSFTIVGVAPTVPQIVVSKNPEPVVYVSLRGEPAPHRFVSIIARAEGDRASIVSSLREEVRKVDPDLPGYYILTMDETLAMARWPQRMFGSMFGLLAGIALVLASVGLYAVTAHGVTQRTQEIGIRVALGAQSPQVVWLFLRRTFGHLVCGLLVGLAGAIGVGRLLERFLVRTAPTDPIALGAVSLLLLVIASIASVWPARRAARVNPVVALRHE
jgi:putative ABC transport system permease protein